MQIRVLGCSGGIGLGFYTSSYLVNHDTLIDAGTGVGQLTIEEMVNIDSIFITHAHMDHIACLPLLVDTTITYRKKPTTIFASQNTIDLLKTHIFNDAIWPDFSQIPSTDHPFIRYQALEPYKSITLNQNQITAIPVQHTIPTVAYQLTTHTGESFVICGDTSVQDKFWSSINSIPNLKGLAIETAFSDGEAELAHRSQHLSPNMLANELCKLQQNIPIYVMHLKPGQSETIIQELAQHNSEFNIKLLHNNQHIVL